MSLAVDRPFDERFGVVTAPSEPVCRAAEGVVPEPLPLIAAVPAVERLARRVVERPAGASLHAGLLDRPAEHVVVGAHHDAPAGIDDSTNVAFDVQLAARGVRA